MHLRQGVYEPWELADVIWSTSKIKMRMPRLKGGVRHEQLSQRDERTNYLHLLARETRRCLVQFDSGMCASVLWGFGMLGSISHDVRDALLQQCNRIIDTFSPAHVAKVIWAIGALPSRGEYAISFVKRHTPRLFAHMDSMSAQDLARVAQGYAACGLVSQGLFDLVAEKSVAMLRDFDSGDLSKLLWAFATVGPPPDVVEQLLEQVAGKMETLLPADCAIVLWALGTWEYAVPDDLMLMIGQRVVSSSTVALMTPTHLADISWSLSKIQSSRTPQLLRELSPAVESHFHSMTPVQLEKVYFAHAKTQCFRWLRLSTNWGWHWQKVGWAWVPVKRSDAYDLPSILVMVAIALLTGFLISHVW